MANLCEAGFFLPEIDRNRLSIELGAFGSVKVVLIVKAQGLNKHLIWKSNKLATLGEYTVKNRRSEEALHFDELKFHSDYN